MEETDESSLLRFVNTQSPIKPVKASHTTHGFLGLNNVSLSTVVEEDGVLKAADSFVATKYDPEDSRISDVATCQLQDGVPYVEGMDVKAEESSKQPDFMSVSQVSLIQDQTTDINIFGAGIPHNNRYDLCGIDPVVDLNFNKNPHEDTLPKKSVFSDVNYCVWLEMDYGGKEKESTVTESVSLAPDF